MKIPGFSRLFLTCLLCGSAIAQVPADPAFWVYPDGATSANPRIASIPPEARTGDDARGGHVMPVEAVFGYALAPFVTFSAAAGGTLEADVRDNTQRKAYELFALVDGDRRLALQVDPTPAGKKPRLVYAEAGRVVATVPLPRRLPAAAWGKIRLNWTADAARLTAGSEDVATLALPRPFTPGKLEVQIRGVDELTVSGEGTFTLDWETGYAARVSPRHPPAGEGAAAGAVRGTLLGFDTYVVSQDPGKRDFPLLQILNGGDGERRFEVGFTLRGEVTGLTREWTQTVRVPARSGRLEPIRFPAPFASDVYHLTARSTEPLFDGAVRKHFLYARPIAGQAVVKKFGLHDSDRKTFGFWPDTLPIHLYHAYSRWAYVYGPAWEVDNALPPETPAEELNWNPLIEWGLRQKDLIPLVSLNSIPDSPWMREREYEPAKMKIYPWGRIGGFPNLGNYGIFVRELARRYRGAVSLYEVENEPMAYLGGMPPADYARLAQTTAGAIHAVAPEARVFGISGTGSFLPWMQAVFQAGGAAGLDGVSIHTYVTPRMPETAQLPEKLAEVRAIAATAGKPSALLNTETGTYVALREAVDQPIANDRLEELIQQGVEPFYQAKGWPNRAVDELSGAISIVRNATYNFLAGTEYFTFFGWNDQWPVTQWWGLARESGFALLSASRDGERTPGRHTLAIAVLTQQLRSARQLEGAKVSESGVSGAVFPTADGGEVAVVWSVQGNRNLLVQNPRAPIAAVSLFGQDLALPPTGPGGRVRLTLGPEPVYLHTARAGLQFLPSPVIGIAADAGGPGTLGFTLVNRHPRTWNGRLSFAAPAGWRVETADHTFQLEPGARAGIQATYTLPPSAPMGTHVIEATFTLPDGQPFTVPIPVKVRPTLVIPRVSPAFAWREPAAWQGIAPIHRLDQPDQVVVGQAPLLASLQEERFWKGANELSARVRFAADEASGSLFVYLDITDAQRRLPEPWPGVLGSCVEVFLDQRPAGAGRGNAAYENGVSQLLVRPGTPVPAIHQATAKTGRLEGIETAGGSLTKTGDRYWIALRLPLTADARTGGFGIDIGLNGPPKEGPGRKSQLMLFGGATNNTDASGFGIATLAPERPAGR